MKPNFSIVRSNFFYFWKYNKQDRFGFSYFINIIKQIDRIFNFYNLLLLDFSIKQNSIYIYFILFNLLKQKCVFTIIFYKINFYLYRYVLLICWLRHVFNSFAKITLLSEKDTNCSSNIDFFQKFIYNAFEGFLCKFSRSKYKIKPYAKLNLKSVLLQNNFIQFSVIFNYELNKKLLFSKKLILNNMFLLYPLININWKYFQFYLKNKINTNFDKIILQFTINLRTLMYIGYFTELFKNSFILLNYLFFLIYTQKQSFSKNILKILKFFQKNLSWLLYNNFIHFFGLKFFLSGKFTNSMRKSRYSFNYGIVSSRLNQYISFSSKYFIIRSGLINFKIWIFF
jgi:hypothetical protein